MTTPDSTVSTPTAARGGRASSALLKLQADERLVAHVRRGNEAAFEVLVQRYHVRLLAFCRHMLGSGARRDAEDVLQEVFTSAYRAMLGDTRPINVRPWLYRIARNRCLNHLRRDPMPSIEGMELTVVDERIGTAETVHQRAEVRQLLSDIQNLPETQRTAILLREIDDLSYEQIAMAMDNTVAAVKSLLVRARVGLAEAAESRRLSCDEVRFELGQHAEGLVDKLTPPTRRHLKDCKSCAAFQQDLKDTNKALAMLAPAFGLVILFKAILAPLGGAGHAGTSAAGGAAATGAASAAGGGLISIGGVLSAKTMTGLAAAVAVTGAAVEVKHVASPQRPASITQQAAVTQKPVQPGAPATQAPSGGVSTAAVPATDPTTPDTPAPTTAEREKTDEPKASTPEATTVSVVLGTTPEQVGTTPISSPGTTPTTTPTIETRDGTAELPDVEDRSDTTTVRTPVILPVPVPPSLRPKPSTPAPTQPAPTPAPTPQPTPTPTPAPAPTPAPTPQPTPTPTPAEPSTPSQPTAPETSGPVDAVAPTSGE